MNMGVPEAPVSPLDKSPDQWNTFWREARPEFPRPGYLSVTNDMNRQQRGLKRRREDSRWEENQARVVRPIRRRTRDTFSEEPPVRGSISCPPQSSPKEVEKMERCQGRCSSSTSFPRFVAGHQKTPSLRHTNIKEVLHYVITDALKVGGRPDSAIAEATDNGERIEVRTRSSNGEASTKWVEWSVSRDVPDSILIDEKDLAKVVSCVTLNAIKFTQNGSITLEATLSAKGRYVVINVKDTGSGIPAAFLPKLFKPFSREDDSTTRQSEGLGLGLMVAKGLARKLGGDLFCLRSHVSGPKKGSEFELRVPLTAGEVCSRPSSPFGSPTPSIRARMSVDPEIPHLDVNREPITPPLSSEPFVGEPRQIAVNGMDTPTVIVHTTPSSNVLGLLSPRRTSSPLRRPMKEPAKKAPVPKLAEELPLNILAVDDNAINRRVLQNMLNRLGYQNVETACNGIDAIEVMHRNSFAPASQAIDLVLMDLWMPHLDGFQAATSILRMPELVDSGRVPTILAVTADVTDAALDKAASSGMKGYVTKPFVTRDLVRLIRTYCATRES
jgi:CheY-like chemotaxis protein